MEGAVVGPEPKKRGRKRKNRDLQNVAMDKDGKKRVVDMRPKRLVGTYVKKAFGARAFLGKIVSYDSGLYRVDYEDGDCEDLDSGELKAFLIEENELEGKWLERKKKLDEFTSKKYAKEKSSHPGEDNSSAKTGKVIVDEAEAASSSVELAKGGDKNNNQVEDVQLNGDGDLSSESCEDDLEQESKTEVMDVPLVPAPMLPPSSGNIGIAEEHVSHLFSVYCFLRSFSIQLFLSPFGLDEFVGALNCTVQNTLLDSVHVALMRVLSRHLEKLSSDGSELAAKCLRCSDWSLLDALTWPVYLVHYLMVIGHIDGSDWKGIYMHILEKDYYTLSAGRKLLVLQILCDGVLDSEELRVEIDMREESEAGLDSDAGMVITPLSGPRRVHPRYSKTSACKDQEVQRIMEVSHDRSKVGGPNAGSDVDQDGNGDECRLCGMDGVLLCCDGCPSSYHARCIGVSKMFIPEGDWFCPECIIKKSEPMIMRGTTLKGAEIFGIDPYDQVFVGTCNMVLVLRGSINSTTCLRYYNQNDLPRLLESLHSNVQHIALYAEICKGIIHYFDIPEEVVSSFNKSLEIARFAQTSLDTSIQSDQLGLKGDSELATKPPEALIATDLSDQYQMKAAVVADLLGQQANRLDSTRHVSREEASGGVHGRSYKISVNVVLYRGSSFKAQGYINNYFHGDFAASAAANLAALSGDEDQVSSSLSLDKRRKAIHANYLLQGKAFSSVAMRFFWPHTERKLVDAPRERCSWCYSCKAPVSSRRGCLLNAAASTAIKGAMKVLASLRPAKNVEGSISGIATYVMVMEESLNGLTLGPFLNATFRKQWRRQLEQATTCGAIKTLLLEFEENIRPVALSGDWVKLVDSGSADSSVIQSGAASAVGSTQKRRPGRRGRKPAAVAEVADDDSKDVSPDFTWWRGGKLSKFLFQKGTLARGLVRKAAREGGKRKIHSIYYAEGAEAAQRNRQLVWRAAVEMSQNVSQLALQVRYLDLHVKWADLARPEQSPQEAKGPETESFIFRNAFVCDKKIVDNEIRYGVAFGSQKHLPSKVMKYIIEKEQSQDGKEKHWFSEMRIPLYLIKEYEANAANFPLSSGVKSPNIWFKLQRKQLKASRKDIFLYLSRKRDNKEKIYCASCQRSLLVGNAAKCSGCQGLCHEQCTISSTVHGTYGVEYLITCKQCYNAKALSKVEYYKESPISPLPLQGEFLNAVVVNKDDRLVTKNDKLVVHKRSSVSPGILGQSAAVQPTKASDPAAQSKSKSRWGLMWKRKDNEDGLDFRLKNILLKGNPDRDCSQPMCLLCLQDYNSDLMYIRCETCNNWFHADAVELKEEKIFELVGFRCCKCRRSKLPACPYAVTKKTSGLKKLLVKGPRPEFHELQQEAATPLLSKKEEIVYVADDDPLLVSYSRVQQLPESYPPLDREWNTATVSGPQKLPVRRNVKPEKNDDLYAAHSSMNGLSSTSFEGNILNSAVGESSPCPEWDVSSNGLVDDNMMFNLDSLNYEDMEFEPQTYFSFHELLASDEGGSERVDNGNPEASYAIPKNEGPPDTSYDLHESLPVGFPDENVTCKMCFQADPSPDLICQTCGGWMHSHCSPWAESPSLDGGWKCGNCREWQ